MPDRYRGVHDCVQLGARIDRTRPPGPAGVAELRQGLPQARQDDAAECRSNLRGGEATEPALRAGEEQHLFPLRSALLLAGFPT